MKKTPLAIAVAASLFFGIGVANAAGYGKSQDKSQQSQATPLDKSFMQLDANLDGYIDRNESQASPMVSSDFIRIDTNRDGMVEPSEFSAFEMQNGRSRNKGAGASQQGQSSEPDNIRKPDAATLSFRSLDTNTDGVIDANEAAIHPTLGNQFRTADTNGDGMIEQSEFSAFEANQPSDMPSTSKAPTNGKRQSGSANGTSRGSALDRAPLPSFSSLDTNADGFIDNDESKAHPSLQAQFNSADTNGDSVIEESEFSAFESSLGTNGQKPSSKSPKSNGRNGGMRNGSSAIQPDAHFLPSTVIMAQAGVGSGGDMGGGTSGGMGGGTSGAINGSGGYSGDSGMGDDTTALPSFTTLDVNGDNVLSPDEAAASRKLSRGFNDADTNRDGAIDQTEFSAFEANAIGTPSGNGNGGTGTGTMNGTGGMGTDSGTGSTGGGTFGSPSGGSGVGGTNTPGSGGGY